ncbi:MAG: sulfite exporter TauE/SafE family protein [Phycisphaeraceae bacterium]|nr:MAG: sulfite exporter TauE/SafE family protein [Phycisphaeraceae bacterium]
MPAEAIPILAALFLLVGALYAAVGHAGASGYLAVMAIMSVEATMMRPTALSINILVATIAFVQFARAGHFCWSLFWPFAAASIPAAFVGGMVHLPAHTLKVAIGIVLALTAVRMASVAWRPPSALRESRQPRPALMLAVGGGVGLVAGLTGTGGGIFLSPVLLLMGWADAKRTAATVSLFILVNSTAGVAGLVGSGWSPPAHLWPLAACAVLGGLIGATLGSRRATPRALNITLAAVLLIAGAKLVLV